MIPVWQTKFSPPDGNCHAACIASILELSLDAVPAVTGRAVVGVDGEKATIRRWHTLQGTLRAMGLQLRFVERNTGDREDWPGWTPDGYWIATHSHPNGVPHSTVWKGTRLMHDPLPGHDPDDRGELVIVEWFDALDPALTARNLNGRWRRARMPEGQELKVRADLVEVEALHNELGFLRGE